MVVKVATSRSTIMVKRAVNVESIEAGFKVIDSNGQSLAYVYGRETKAKADADIAKVLTMDEARRIASNIAKLPIYLAATPHAANE
jgi:hypothetical protein